MAKIPHGSIEYLHVPISLDEDAVGVTVSGITVELAVITENSDPTVLGESIWKAAFVTPVDDLSAVAKVLTPTGLAAGRYAVWARITASPEKVLRKAGNLTVT